MPLPLNSKIAILGSRIPVRKGTKTYIGFQELRACNGKTYKYFRDLSRSQFNSKNKRFSPSAVWRVAEEKGFARFEDSAVSPSCSKSPDATNQVDLKEISFQEKKNEFFPTLNEVRKLVVAKDVSLASPGIYAWKITGIGTYIGKYTHKSRPLGEYNRNVSRLLHSQAYRPQKPNGFRRIHRALANAVADDIDVELHILENCVPQHLNERERYFISTMADGNLNG